MPLADTVGAWLVIKAVVLQLGYSKLWVEGDALGIIHPFKKGTGLDGYDGSLVEDISRWLSMLNGLKVSHILSEGNGPADFMVVGESKGIEAEYGLR